MFTYRYSSASSAKKADFLKLMEALYDTESSINVSQTNSGGYIITIPSKIEISSEEQLKEYLFSDHKETIKAVIDIDGEYPVYAEMLPDQYKALAWFTENYCDDKRIRTFDDLEFENLVNC